MATFDQPNGAGVLRLIVSAAASPPPNIALNQSTVNVELHLLCGNGISFNGSPVGWSASINTAPYSGGYTFNFGSYSDKLIASWQTLVAHNPDGTKTINVSAHTDHTGTSAIGGPIDVSGTFTIPAIPRGPQVEVDGLWGTSLLQVEFDGAWATGLMYAEFDGAWVLVA